MPTSFAGFAPSEWTAVLADDPKNERGRLVPLLLEKCELPALIKPLNYIDVTSADKLEQNYAQIWQRVGKPEPHDIEQRSKEIDELFEQRKLDQVLKRLLDFARDFAKRDIFNKILAIIVELDHVDKERDVSKRAMARVDLITAGLNLREGIINSLSHQAVI